MPASVQIPVTQTGLEASIQAALRNAGKNAQINLGTNSRQINALAQPLGRITGQADEFTKSMEAANARVFAFGASVGIINGVSRAFSSLVKNTIEVEKSLTEINSVFGKSSSEIEKFGDSLFNVAKNTGQSFDTVAKGALELARQGLSTEESLKRINDALILTRLSGLDAEASVAGLTAAVNAFKSTGVTTSEVLNKLVTVSQKYSVSERDLIEGLKRSSSVAKQAGVSLDELLGVITAVQERTSVGGAVIGNSFKTIFTRLQDTGNLEALQDLGVTVTDVQGRILPATKLLENLAVTIKGLNQIQVAEITEKIGGGFQIDKLLATLEDLSSESSVAFKATELSLKSTNQAYEKNAALNVTLAALINQTSLSAEQLGATLGKIGITDSAKNLLGFFNGLLESIQKILNEESALGDVVRGLTKGIGNLITGPGLALFAAIILKLSKDLAQFGFASLKGFFGIGKAAKEIQNVEQSIAAALSKNINLQRQLFALEGNRTAQIKVMSDAIVMQEAAMRKMASTASSLAVPLYQQGVRSSGEGLRVPKAAGGYMPAVAQESSDIKKGVGGAKAGDRPVVIPNFNFGQGKKGSIVAHTGEYAVPNFGGSGGTAIFNRDMVRSMGMPKGAKKISASGGLIPNFAITGLAAKDFDKEGGGIYKILAGRIFESLLRGEDYIDLTENVVGPDINKGKFKIREAKLSGEAAWRDSNFGAGKLKGSSLILPKTAKKDFDEKLISKKGADIFRSEITHQKLFGIAKKLIDRESLNKKTNLSKINLASSGFIPNFADNILTDTIRKYYPELENYRVSPKKFVFPNGVEAYQSNIDNVLKRSQSVATVRKQTQDKAREQKLKEGALDFPIDAGSLGGIALVTPRQSDGIGYVSAKLKASDLKSGRPQGLLDDDEIILNNIQQTGVPTKKNFEQISSEINKFFAGPIVALAQSLYGQLYSGMQAGEFASQLGNLKSTSTGGILPPGAEGQLFEAASKAALTTMKDLSASFDPKNENRPFDFTNPASMNKILGVKAVRGDAKRGGGDTGNFQKQINDFVKKSLNDGSLAPKILSQISQQSIQKGRKPNNAAKGFIPNFVSKAREIGSGAEARFLKLGTKGGIDVGVKKFIKDGPHKGGSVGIKNAISKEWLISQYINRYLNIPGVYGPKIVSGYNESQRRGGIRKEIISGLLAKAAVGREKADLFGGWTLRSAVKTRGLDLPDLHGSNYIVNKQAAEYINKLDNYPTDAVRSMSALKEMASRGGVASIIDPGFAKLTGSPAIDVVDQMLNYIDSKKKQTAAKGFLPNFANPLKDAVNREMAAGVPASQIYIDKNPSLKNAANPMGLMVANRRDEPAGGFQGINRARKEGMNPQTYGAASGFVPNYADAPDISGYVGKTRSAALAEELKNYQKALKELAKASLDLKKDLQYTKNQNSKEAEALRERIKAIKENAQELKKSSEATRKVIIEQSKGVFGKGKTLTGKEATVQAQGGQKDMLGTIFAVQSAMTVLTGATEGASGNLGKFVNATSEAIGSFSTAAFAIQGLSSMGGAVGSVVSKLGPYGLAIAGITATYSAGAKFLDEYYGITRAAADNVSKMSAAAEKAAFNLNNLPENISKSVEESGTRLVKGAARENSGVSFMVDFQGSDLFSAGELEKGLTSVTQSALKAGVSYDAMWNQIREKSKDGKLTVEEVNNLTDSFTKLLVTSEQFQNAKRNLDLSLEGEIGKEFSGKTRAKLLEELQGKLKPGAEIQEGAVGKIQAGILGELTQDQQAAFDINSDAVKSKILEIFDAVTDTKNAFKDANKEALDLSKISFAQNQLKNAIDISIAQQRATSELDLQLLSAKELGNLSEKGLRSLENQIALRDLDRKLVDETSGFLKDQIDQAKLLVADTEKTTELEEKLKKFREDDFTNRTKVSGLLGEINSLIGSGNELIEAQKKEKEQILDRLFNLNNLEKEGLKTSQEKTEEYKQQAETLRDIISSAQRASQQRAFNVDISSRRSEFSNAQQISQLQASKVGKSTEEIRVIDAQIAAIEANTVAVQNAANYNKMLEEKRVELFGLAKPTNDVSAMAYRDAFESAKTVDSLIKEAEALIGATRFNEGDNEAVKNFILKLKQDSERLQLDTESSQAAADARVREAGAIEPVISALEMFRRSLLDSTDIIDRKIQDLELEKLTSISGRRNAEIDYEIETLNQQRGESAEEAAKIARERQAKTIPQLFKEEFSKTNEERTLELNKTIVDASVQFKNNLVDGISEAIEGGKSLSDTLRAGALDFVRQLNKKLMSNAIDSILGSTQNESSGIFSSISKIFAGNGKASGGPILGGSGNKDDVPAMLMGGEYVINKKSVGKYGPKFLEAINNGTLGGYANGGLVQSGKGGFFVPGTYGLGGIEGRRNLLDFATQGYTSGQRDEIFNEGNSASISLEPESVRLTNFGRRNSPQADTIRAAKEQAFGLYTEDLQREIERKKQEKEEKKAFRRQLITTAIMAVGSFALKGAATGFKEGIAGAAKDATWFQKLQAGFSGVGEKFGNFGSGVKSLFSGNLKQAENYFGMATTNFANPKEAFNFALERSGVSYNDLEQNQILEVNKALGALGLPGLSGKNNNFGYNGFNPPAFQTGPFDARGNYIEERADDRYYATGGLIPSAGGIDTVPAMLSGGEFIMNRSAAQGIGAGNLQALNAGAGSIVTEEKTEELNEKLLAKLDELIEASSAAGNITINVDGSTGRSSETTDGNASEQKQQLARQIKDVVIKVIQEEKRLGGSLRK